jgi:hypothetical protein
MVGADEAGKDLLEDIWRYLKLDSVPQPNLYLLYTNTADGGLMNVNPLASLLVKTNLSTESNPASRLLLSALEDSAPAETAGDAYSATLDDGKNFVKLLWECSVVSSGGFYLHYEEGDPTKPSGVPQQAFADGVAAAIDLLIMLDLPGDALDAPARSFHNCVVTPANVNPEAKGILLAETPDTVKVLSIPPGHLGFQLQRTAPPTSDVERLYQLLGYRMRANDNFNANYEGLPVGPISKDGWLYERMIPIFSFAKESLPVDQADLPPASSNPYLGIKKDAQAQIEFYWQDVYGNRLAEDGAVKLRDVRYVDPLIGINQWPTVAESYAFTPAGTGQATLSVELVFDRIAYQPIGDQPSEQVRQKISAARALYERIYYQINQPDLSFTISTTVLPQVAYRLNADEKGRITEFVNNAYRYLSMLERGSDPPSAPIAATIAIVLATTIDAKPAYPANSIFPVTVQLDMARDPDLVDTKLIDAKKGVPAIQRVAAFLKASTPAAIGTDSTGNPSSEIVALREFAASFEDALPGLRLAIGNDQPHKHTASAIDLDDPDEPPSRPLWAVRLGEHGIGYNIQEELPYFFTPAPLANTLLSATVDIDTPGSIKKAAKRLEAIDINVLAHDFLVAVEAFLEPALVVPAMQRKPKQAQAILEHKKTLAAAIRDQVTYILEQTKPADIEDRRNIAAEMLHQQLLINLVEAYDIETIVQYNVDVELAEGVVQGEPNPPRLYGQPIVKGASRSSSQEPIDAALLNFTLSPGRVPLDPKKSYLTFFFNTRTPEKFEDLTLELIYRVNELEHDIVDVPGVKGYQASSWLSFIRPIDTIDETAADKTSNANYIGPVPIPIPLRTYPTPPSMVMHTADADPDSQRRLEDIRQWQYCFVYEHLDVAQDTIEAAVRYNVVPPAPVSNGAASQKSAATSNVPSGITSLFNELVNFAAIYPQLAPDLQGLASDLTLQGTAADSAVDMLEQLIGRVAEAWKGAKIGASGAQSATIETQYQIDEITTDQTKAVTIQTSTPTFPDIVVPGYKQDSVETRDDGKAITHHFSKKTPAEAAADPIFGESSIPDRKLIIPDRDIIGQQNAWGAIWLTRNKELISGRATSPVFVYQTPQVSFANMVTPLLVNTQSWYIDRLGAADGITPQSRSLADHIQQLFKTLLPKSADQSYDIRLACRYAFSLVPDTGQGAGLVSMLPVLLGPRLTIMAGEQMLDQTQQFRANVAQAIDEWKGRNKPLTTNGMYIFSLAIFSHLDTTSAAGDNTKLPLLRIEDLRLRLENIVPAAQPVVLEAV